eukprot:5936166-Prymnesium_polylepis.1
MRGAFVAGVAVRVGHGHFNSFALVGSCALAMLAVVLLGQHITFCRPAAQIQGDLGGREGDLVAYSTRPPRPSVAGIVCSHGLPLLDTTCWVARGADGLFAERTTPMQRKLSSAIEQVHKGRSVSARPSRANGVHLCIRSEVYPVACWWVSASVVTGDRGRPWLAAGCAVGAGRVAHADGHAPRSRT